MATNWSELSREIQDKFSLEGNVKVDIYYDEVGNEKVEDDYTSCPTKYDINIISKSLKQTSLFECGKYGAIDTWIYLALTKYSIKDKTVLLIGSADQGYGPWYESIVVNMGGIPVVTDYNEIIYESLEFKFWSIEKLKNKISEGFKFDAILSISSIEHDGLGRYGDQINPEADFETMKLLGSYLKKDGLFFLSVPVGSDRLCYNIHRVYGKHRLPKLLENWIMIDSFGYDKEYLDRNVGSNWWHKTNDGNLLFNWYPAYEPLFVLKWI